MPKKTSYRDFLIEMNAAAIKALAEGIDLAMQMDYEDSAISMLESSALTARALLKGKPNPETVEARPEWGPDHPSYDEMGG